MTDISTNDLIGLCVLLFLVALPGIIHAWRGRDR